MNDDDDNEGRCDDGGRWGVSSTDDGVDAAWVIID